jgi:hypothetical protein
VSNCTVWLPVRRAKRYNWGMGTGLGKTQQRILDALAGEQENVALTIKDLAQRVGVSDRQMRAAVRALERRGLVVITKEFIGWTGVGEYGSRFPAWQFVEHPRGEWVRSRDNPTGPMRHTRMVADPDDPRWVRGFNKPVGAREPQGMPRAGLLVWLAEKRASWLERDIERSRELAKAFGVKPNIDERVAELERLTGGEQ